MLIAKHTKDPESIYDYDYLLKNVWKLISNELSENNAKLVHQYDRTMVTSSLSKATRHKHLKMILSLSRFLKKDWSDLTKEDIEELVWNVMENYGDSNGQETNTSWDHKKVLKIFFRWLKLGSRDKNEVGDPDETKNIKTKRVKDKIIREDLLTDADKVKLLHACGGNARDRAFIDCHFEAGTRPGEILNLQIRHVRFDQYGAVLNVDGKTGARTIRLVKATPNLAAWIDVHPQRDNPSASLWPNLSHNHFGEPLTYAGARQMLKRRCHMANLSKRVYLNLFRHSEATVTANFMTEAQMRKRHGWTSESRMPARYVHLVNADVEDAIFKKYGIKKEDDVKLNLPLNCHYCGISNSSESNLCIKCGKPLDVKSAEELDKKQESERKMFLEKIERLEEKYDVTNKRLELVLGMIENAQKNNSRIFINRIK